MNKVCGNCNFQIDTGGGNNGIRVRCAYDDIWHQDNYGCEKWKEFCGNLSLENRLALMNEIKNQEIAERGIKTIVESSEIKSKNQIKLAILAFLLGIIGTIMSQYIWSLWLKSK